jgi:hypothetical protein
MKMNSANVEYRGTLIMKSRIENIFDKSKKKKDRSILISLLVLLISSSALISCNSTTTKNQTISSESLPQITSKDEATTKETELEVPDEVVDPYVFEVNELKTEDVTKLEAEKYSDIEMYGTIEDKKQKYYGKIADKVTYYYEMERFYFKEDLPDVINGTLKQIYDENENIYKEASAIYSAGKADMADEEKESPSYNFFHFLDIKYIGDDYISIYYNNINYPGGVHPYSNFIGITIDCKTGKQVTASELLGKSDDEILKEVSEAMGMEVIGTWDDIGFYITDSTIVFFYRMPLFWDDVVWPRK